ncbi:FIST signal transduction protein [Legionella maceachernii]|uniref:FIST N domain protein n=1 Tax=Legionella maceachernii TaxID=466 RepID=A0A0W0WHV7_9GAMM|nr:FIST N-terminal domain-containing protein [Legionella maceachernii]KTD31811.1 FIST N domain protein [Legionella maceachernii]SJZ98040.1 Uncharacterized conserved protein, contains FIST_N domain [Legionella maceachernii]SUP01119.1 Uncharacterized conserved protein [Legionella maceachernii]
MEVQAFQYLPKTGWSLDHFPQLDSEQTLILIFASPEFLRDPQPIKEIAGAYKKSKILGCSSAGEIFGAHIFDHSLSVVVAKFDKTKIKIAKAKVNSNEDSFAAGESITQQLLNDELSGIFVLSDGLKINGSELVKGLNSLAPDSLVITGGLAGDGSDFKHTWTIFNGDIITDHVIAAGFYGNHIHIGHGSKGGWDIFGPLRRITRSSKNILYELDHRPALQLYKEYLGERAADLPASGLLYPLAIRDMTSNECTPLVRTILGVDEESQSLIFAGDMPAGYHAQLMRANFDRLITSASEAGETAMKKIQRENKSIEPALIVSISCVGRRLLLGERTEEETESTLESFPAGSTQIGFYSYGELSPLVTPECKLHNQTMTLTTYAEFD